MNPKHVVWFNENSVRLLENEMERRERLEYVKENYELRVEKED
jgi:hypothetical protein